MDKQKLIEELIEIAILDKSSTKWFDLGGLSNREIEIIKEKINIDVSDYKRVITVQDINHSMNRHGDKKVDSYPIDYSDFLLIPFIISNFDEMIVGDITKTTNLQSIIWVKEIGDKYFFVEEIRKGRKKLALKTLYKKPLKTQ